MSEQAPTTVDVYQILKMQNQVLADIRELAKLQLVALDSLLTFAQERAKRTAPGAAGKPLASDADLDGQYGDPIIVAKDPRDWSGDSMKGKHFSECPAEYLDMVADRLDYFSSQLGTGPEDTKKRGYNMKDAARARGWAVRQRNGWKPTAPQPPASSNPFGDDDASF